MYGSRSSLPIECSALTETIQSNAKAEAAAATAEPAPTIAPAAGGGKQRTEERPASEAALDAAAALLQGAMATVADDSWTMAAASEAELDQAAALIQGAVETVADEPPDERLR